MPPLYPQPLPMPPSNALMLDEEEEEGADWRSSSLDLEWEYPHAWVPCWEASGCRELRVGGSRGPLTALLHCATAGKGTQGGQWHRASC